MIEIFVRSSVLIDGLFPHDFKVSDSPREHRHVFTLLKDGDHYEFTIWTDEEILKDDIQQLKKTEAIMELPKGEFKMPKWMGCSWRRISCGKSDCPICGRIQQDRLRHIMAGENPDDIKSCLEDVGRNFKEILARIKEDCEERGIEITNIDKIQEPPEPKEFPLYQKVKKWRDEVVFAFDNPLNEFLVYTEAGQDILWYVNTLLSKVDRQFCNKWHIENGDEYGDVDFKYTRYVLKECISILEKSLRELEQGNSSQKEIWKGKLSGLSSLGKEILKIAPKR